MGKTGSSIWTTTGDQPEAKHVHEIIQTLHQESDRSVAIIGASIVEAALTASLKRFLHQEKKVADELFRSTGPLGTFATKIHLGLLIGLYGSDAHRDLDTMRAIRNRFAHRLSVSSFAAQEIASLTMNLKLVERHTADATSPHSLRPSTWQIGVVGRDEGLKEPRERYLMSAQIFSMGLAIPHNVGMPQPVF